MKKRAVNFMVVILMLALVVQIFFGEKLASVFEHLGGEKGKVVVLDSGHGGDDPGKIGINDAKEKDINLAITLKLREYLEAEGITVVMTREADESLHREGASNKKRDDMNRRVEIIEDAKPDLTVSIHQNSYPDGSVCGPQVFYYKGSEAGEKAALLLQDHLNADLEIARPRAAKENNDYYLLKKSSGAMVIAECGFLSNYEEAQKLITEGYQDQVAKAVCAGILEYLDMDGTKTETGQSGQENNSIDHRETDTYESESRETWISEPESLKPAASQEDME